MVVVLRGCLLLLLLLLVRVRVLRGHAGSILASRRPKKVGGATAGSRGGERVRVSAESECVAWWVRVDMMVCIWCMRMEERRGRSQFSSFVYTLRVIELEISAAEVDSDQLEAIPHTLLYYSSQRILTQAIF